MLAIEDTLAKENVEIEETDNQIIWVCIKYKCQIPLFICSFYRNNKDNDPKALDDLPKALDHVSQLSAKKHPDHNVCGRGFQCWRHRLGD